MSKDKKYEFEVGISFLSKDESFAKQLFEKLSEKVSVFFYRNHENEAAFRNLPEFYIDAFSRRIRFAVILYRDGWGKSGMTGYEKSAIQKEIECDDDRGQGFVFLVKMEDSVPGWYQMKHYSNASLGVEKIADRILFKLEEVGGIVQEFTAEQKLAIHQKMQIDKAERIKYLTDYALKGEVMYQKAFPEFNRLGELFTAKMKTVNNGYGITQQKAGEGSFSDGPYYCYADGKKTMYLKWVSVYADSVQESVLCVYYGAGHDFFRHNNRYKSNAYKSYSFTVDANKNPGWADLKDPDSFYSSEQVLEDLYSKFVEYIIKTENAAPTRSYN